MAKKTNATNKENPKEAPKQETAQADQKPFKECVPEKPCPPARATPAKRKGSNFSLISSPNKKNSTKPKKIPKEPLQVNGFAFKHNIIGLTHEKNDGSDAFNGQLREMVDTEQLKDAGISTWVTLRDINTGKLDKPLKGPDGYNKIIFLSINTTEYNDHVQAKPTVLAMANTVYNIVADPMNNLYGYQYKPVTDESYKNKQRLFSLGDLVRFNDIFRVLVALYGNDDDSLPPGFAKRYPDTISEFVEDPDEIPDYIKTKLGY